MPSGLPWSDPDSDPLADLRTALDAYRQAYLAGLDVNGLARYQFETWLSYHLIAHGGSFLFERNNEFTEWIECASCHDRLILPMGKHKGKINGMTPSLIIHDEFVGLDRVDWQASIADKVYQRIYQSGRRSGKQARMANWLAQDDRSALTPDTHHDALIALCLEHPWLSKQPNTGGSVAATPSTRSAT